MTDLKEYEEAVSWIRKAPEHTLSAYRFHLARFDRATSLALNLMPALALLIGLMAIMVHPPKIYLFGLGALWLPCTLYYLRDALRMYRSLEHFEEVSKVPHAHVTRRLVRDRNKPDDEVIEGCPA